MCKRELDDFGAIILSPPDSFDKVEKFHVCKKCYAEIIKQLTQKNN